MRLRKKIVFTGVILLLIGFAIPQVLSKEESYTHEKIEDTWDLQASSQQLTLPPGNKTFFGRLMEVGFWFEFDVTSSSTTKIVISAVQRDPEPTTVPIYENTGIRFTEIVPINSVNTYYVEIKNEGSLPVTLTGKVFVKKQATDKRVVYPYTFPGFLIALIGMGAIIFGVLSKPRKPTKRRHGHKMLR